MGISQLKRTIVGTMDEIITKQTSDGIDTNVKYVTTDAPTFSITNQQMNDAITTQQRFYNNDDVYLCIDDGTYTKGALYKFVVNEETYSWEKVEVGTTNYLSLSGTNGTLTDEQYALVTAYDDLIISIDGNNYRQTSKPVDGAGDYTYLSKHYVEATGTASKENSEYILIIKSDKTWKTISETNNNDNAVLFNTAQSLTVEQQLLACANIGLEQSFGITDADDTTIIRIGNILFQYATFTMTGNTEKVFSFPLSYDNGKPPACWCNSVAEGQSMSNSSSVIDSNRYSMTVRTCGVDSAVTFFALGCRTAD